MSYFNLPEVREVPICHPMTNELGGFYAEIPDRKALVLDNGAVAGVPTSSYKTVQHEEFFSRFKEYLLDSMGSYAEGYSERVSQSHHGARAKVLWEFPRMSFDMKHKDGTAFANKFFVYARHSHDGKWGPTCVSGLMNFFCENLDMGGEWKLFRGRHTSGFSLDDFLSPNVDWVSDFVEQRTRQEVLQARSCSDSMAIDFLEIDRKSPGQFSRLKKGEDGKPILQTPSIPGRGDYANPPDAFQRELNSNGDNMFDRWKIETGNYGATLFALASSVTYWASHDSEMFPCRSARRGASRGNKNVMASLQARQDMSRTMLGEYPFTEAA